MKVAIFTDTFLPQINGVTNTLSKLVEYYESVGIEYLIFAPNDELKEADKSNIERFFSLKFFLYPECRVAIPNLFRLNSTLKNFNPDIIHLMTEFNMGLLGLKYGKKHGIPTISNYTTNFCQYLNYYNLDFLNPHIWNYMRWFHNENDLTLCPSEETRELLKKNGITNVNIFSRGIDSEKYNPALRSNPLRESWGIHNKLVLLYVGRISPEKDLDIFMESYKRVYEKHEDKIALVITGEGPYLENCKNGFPKDTIFTGFKKGKELAEIYASSDIFVCPSSTETFGNVVLEAMSSGLPVIGADAGGVKETINNRINGLKFKAREVNELENAILELIENEELRTNIRKEARITGLNRSWDKIFEVLIDNYNYVLLNKSTMAV